MPSSATPPQTASPGVLIRQATAKDLWAVRSLLSLRDEREWDDSGTAWFLYQLDPQRCLAWLAFDQDKPVGLTSMFIRRLSWKGTTHRLAYWANLYIHPEYRDVMLYPRLPLAMFTAIKEMGIELLYGAVRLPEVARAHLSLGFVNLGQIPVLIKPLRPGRLLAKHKRMGHTVATISAPADALYAGLQALRRPTLPPDITIKELDLDSADVEALVEMLNTSGGEKIRQPWTVESFRYRYERTREAGQYHILASRRSHELVGAVILRFAQRGNQVQAGVVMDVAFATGGEDAAQLALAEAERRAYRAGCDLMLYLDGLGAQTTTLFRRLGYRASSERYDLLIWPKAALARGSWEMDPGNWRFSFRDHDAF